MCSSDLKTKLVLVLLSGAKVNRIWKTTVREFPDGTFVIQKIQAPGLKEVDVNQPVGK